MKKNIIYIIVSIVLITIFQTSFGCSFDWNIRNSLDNCFLNTDVISPPEDLEVINGGWFNRFLLLWIDAIAWVLALATVGIIAYGSFMFTTSTWEEEKITKAKDIIKWWLIGFIGIITANALIELVINILYDI